MNYCPNCCSSDTVNQLTGICQKCGFSVIDGEIHPLTKSESGSQPLAQVFSTTTITPMDLAQLTPEQINERVQCELAHGIADFLVQHWKELPVTMSQSAKANGVEYKISAVLISDEQLFKFRQESDELLLIQQNTQRARRASWE